jgi:hypothetical protein
MSDEVSLLITDFLFIGVISAVIVTLAIALARKEKRARVAEKQMGKRMMRRAG